MEHRGARSAEEQKLKSMQETNLGQGSVEECVWTSATKMAHLFIEFEGFLDSSDVGFEKCMKLQTDPKPCLY